MRGPGPGASVVVNNYNYGRYLPDALDSALGQTWAGTEVIVVDDGSTDESRHVIARYADRVKVVLQENRGQCAAVNAGFAASSGDVVIFLDADDMLLPTAVEEATRALAGGGVSQVHWPLIEVDVDKAPTGRLQPTWSLRGGSFLNEAVEAGPVPGLATQLSGNAWSRRFLSEVVPLPEQRVHFADMYLFTLCPVHGASVLIDHPLSLYRAHRQNDHLKGSPRHRFMRLQEGWQELCRVLALELARLNHEAPTGDWPERNQYGRWLAGWREVVERVDDLIPPGETYVFIDDGNWGGADLTGCRTAVPFLERDGVYWGPPGDDEQARAELERQQQHGSRYLVVADQPGTWKQTYPRFWSWLRDRFECLVDDELLSVFSLAEAANPA